MRVTDGTPAGRRRSGDEDVRFSAEHLLRRSLPPAQPESEPRGAARRRTILRYGVVLFGAAVLALLLVGYSDMANPDHAEAKDLADRITAAWESIADGGVAPDQAAAAAGLRAFTFEFDDMPRVVLTHPEPTAAGACYALRFGPGILTEAGILLEPDTGCTPRAPGLFLEAGAWSEILPEERMTPWWFLPAMFVLCGAGLAAVVGIVIAVVTVERRRGA